MPGIRRASTFLTVVLFVMGLAKGAQAHAGLAASDPRAGSELQAAPSEVVLTFTEDVDPRVSSIKVLDTEGKNVTRAEAELAAGEQSRMRISLNSDLEQGVYTVTWKVLSKVDGHVTAGTFAFGVGVSPEGAKLPVGEETETPGATVLSVGSRVLIYLGMMLLIGAATLALFILGVSESRNRAFLVASIGWACAFLGVLLLAVSLQSETDASYSDLLRTGPGRGIVWRVAALGVSGVGLLVARRAKAFWFVVGAASAAAAAVHVWFGHAAATSVPALHVAAQTVHVWAVSVWIGGLATLLLLVGRMDSQPRARLVRRYSLAAGGALAVVVLSGGTRALHEVASWNRLFTTPYGRAVAVKIVLLGVLALLGGINRYWNVKRAGESVTGLLFVGRVELVVAAVVLGTTGFLASVAPARIADAGSSLQRTEVVVEGEDFATTVRARLQVTPGRPGPNNFELRLVDYDTREPVAAKSVRLTFRFPVNGFVEPSTLELKTGRKGVFTGKGANLAINGPWLVDVLITSEQTSTQLTMTMPTRLDQQVDVVSGDPTLYTVKLGDSGSVQLYVDPARSGANEVHATFFDASGAELPGLTDPFLIATRNAATPETLPVRLLSPGHFVANGELRDGKWRFDVIATAPDGGPLNAYFEHRIVGGSRR